jgi:hypothetical protein
MVGMAREKATITLDRAKAKDAMLLLEVHTVSEAVDRALDRLIKAERLRRDIAAYRRTLPPEADMALVEMPVEFDLHDDAVDYESDYRTGG